MTDVDTFEIELWRAVFAVNSSGRFHISAWAARAMARATECDPDFSLLMDERACRCWFADRSAEPPKIDADLFRSQHSQTLAGDRSPASALLVLTLAEGRSAA